MSSLAFTGCAEASAKAPVKKSLAITTQQSQTNTIKYYFTKVGQHPDKHLIEVIDSSTKTLDIAIYSLTKQSIVDAIIKAKDRGVTVRIMTDKVESKNRYEKEMLTILLNDNIPVKINSHAGLMHIKMTIADNIIGTTGSYNYTASATKNNDEILVVISDMKVATDFDNEFNSMWINNMEYKDYK